MKCIFYLLLLLSFSIPAHAQDSTKTISVIAVGDMMLGTDFPRNRLPASNGEYLLKDVYSILSSADITIGNYEGVLLDGGKPRKICRDTTKCYLFRTPTRYISNLVNAGFDLLSIANNHANDFGSNGIASTQILLMMLALNIPDPLAKLLHIFTKALKLDLLLLQQAQVCIQYSAFLML